MRIVEAQEAERVRLAQEVHDGPAQALSNAIFQVEFIDRIFDSDPRHGPDRAAVPARAAAPRARRRAHASSASCGRRSSPSSGCTARSSTPSPTRPRCRACRSRPSSRHRPTGSTSPPRRWSCAWCRRPCRMSASTRGATNVVVTTGLEDGQWVLEVRDDGRGFDTGAVAARGRRNFGLQFMRERAELVGAQFEVTFAAGCGHGRPAGDPVDAEGDRMTEYQGPERRRGNKIGGTSPTSGCKILIVDDHALFRVGIREILAQEPDLEIVAEADDPRTAIDAAFATNPDVILMDLSLPAPGGIETTQRVKRELPAVGDHRPVDRGGRGRAVRGHQGRRGGVHPQGHRARRPRHGHPPRRRRRVPDQRQGVQPGRPSPRACSRSSASSPSTARRPPRSSRRSRRARWRSSTTSRRA